MYISREWANNILRLSNPRALGIKVVMSSALPKGDKQDAASVKNDDGAYVLHNGAANDESAPDGSAPAESDEVTEVYSNKIHHIGIL